VIGAGNFASRVLIPLLKQHGARLRTIVSGGPSGAIAADSFGFERVTTDVDDVFSDASIDTVFVVTRHDTHASFVTRALESGKNVFVEKPLALTIDDLDDIETAARSGDGLLMVGFNRRFAPMTREVIAEVSRRSGPVAVNITVNAGAIPREHWTQNPTVGGGRIVGEGCHFIDLARAIVGHDIVRVDVTAAATSSGESVDDVALMLLGFSDGSIASIAYLANGAKTYPKERIECFFDGRTLAIDNWRKLHRFGLRAPLFELSKRQDKGHSAEVDAWLRAVKQGGPAPIPLEELIEVSRWSIEAGAMARRGR
jgi:predicted dehydrogenase